MHPPEPAGVSTRPRWSEVLRALREARGVTLDGWGARLGVSRTTIQRWERGERAPDPGAESAILAYCREMGLLRTYDRGPLAGLNLTAELLQELLTEARWRVSGGATPTPASVAPPAPAAADAAAESALSNLPVPLSSFVGRERELAALRRVQAGSRLVTLTGVGGVGKTRLSLALAGELLWAYPHGVWLVNLAPLADPELLPQAVATALSIRPSPALSLPDALVEALRGRHALLLLDNCEHLLPDCAGLVEHLLRGAPALEVVATSREPLGIPGETVWRVPPLTIPADPATSQATPDAAELTDSERLLIERARLRRPDLELTPADCAAVATICRQLDGIPLALELAAARVTVLSLGQIAERLRDRFQLLTGGGHTALPRHRTLRAAIDWSYELLSGPERAALRRLSVFAGGFTLEAAEAVCGEAISVSTDEPGEPEGGRLTEPTLDLLARLVDKSLVVADQQDGEARYRMLETVRAYAAEQLMAAAEVAPVRERHAGWCVALAEEAWTHQRRPDQQQWLERLAGEHDNLRAAMTWRLRDQGGDDAGLRIAGALLWFWLVRGHLSEGRQWLTALLKQVGAPPPVRARALEALATLVREQGDFSEAIPLFEQCLDLRREVGDELAISGALTNLGIAHDMNGDHLRARDLYEEALALARRLGDQTRIAANLTNLGIVARQAGDLDLAVALHTESLASTRALGDTHFIAAALLNLGNAHRDRGQTEQAASFYAESVRLYQELRDRQGAARCMQGMAGVAVARGDARLAATLCGAVAAMRAAIGIQVAEVGRVRFEQTVDEARAALGDEGFAGAWAAGQALTFDAAVEAVVGAAGGT